MDKHDTRRENKREKEKEIADKKIFNFFGDFFEEDIDESD